MSEKANKANKKSFNSNTMLLLITIALFIVPVNKCLQL